MIGVLGGSFDPIHFGHIKPLIEVTRQFNFSEIKLIPTFCSPVGKKFHANFEHRMNMVSIICSSSTNNFSADDIEMKRKGISYTYDTIRTLKDQNKNDDFCLIMGLDVFLKIETWFKYENILNEVNILVINRPGRDIEEIKKMGSLVNQKISKNKEDFLNNKNYMVYFYNISPIEISSSAIRNIIKEGNNPVKKIPGSIMSYIERNKLYRKEYE